MFESAVGNVNVKNEEAVMEMIENLKREDLSYMDEAKGYLQLINNHSFTQEQLAKKIGRSQSTIANKIRLLKLTDEVKKILADNNLSERHARSLLKLTDEALQIKVLRYVFHKRLNVKKNRRLIEKLIERHVKKPGNKTPGKFTKAIKDIRIFVNTIKQAVETMKVRNY